MFEVPPLKIARYFPRQGDAVSGYSFPLLIGIGKGVRTHLMPIPFRGDPQTSEPLEVLSKGDIGGLANSGFAGAKSFRLKVLSS